MLASIISTIGKNDDKGVVPNLRVEYLETQILLMAPTTNVKSFLYFGDYFLWYPEVMGVLEPLVYFISGPARTFKQPYQ